MEPDAFMAAFYEAEYGPLEADVAFFSRRACGGRLLVLGCGTGRVSRRLGGDREVVGLDLSDPSLDLARRLDPVNTYVHGDMRAFSLGVFGEVIIPNGAFAFLPTRSGQHACLSACRAALPAGGTLTIDIPMPRFDLWSQPHTPATPVWKGRLFGKEAVRTRETHRSLALQRLHLVDRYTLDGEEVAQLVQILRVMLPSELEWMLEATGFYIEEQLGDYSGGPIRDAAPRILTRAVAL